jgi:UDP-N-acetylglucosamine 1-carboxyvinyltransferase
MAETAVRTPMLETFVIEGGAPLNGRVAAAGNKNAALPILAACLLTAEPVTLTNVPRIRDVETMVELLADLGAEAEWTGPNEVRVVAAEVSKTAPDEALSDRIRASFLLAGPLLARFGSADMPLPGGDVIGRRRLDTHVHAFSGLGAEIDVNHGYHMRTSGRLRGAELFLDEASVMGSENAVMAAVLADGQTVIGNTACEPHVQDLCRFLVELGAQIEGIGSNVLRIEGVGELHGGSHRISPDHIEIVSFIGLAAITDGEIRIDDVEPADLRPMDHHLRRLGIRYEVEGTSVRVGPQELEIQDDIGGYIPKLDTGTWPQFPADCLSIGLVVATQARGTILVHEKMFESRLFFVDKLIDMGARIILCDPHRAVVTGPAQLRGQRMSSPDIRAGMAMLIAGLAAEGTSTIGSVGVIDRGYERIDERLRALGANIERV